MSVQYDGPLITTTLKPKQNQIRENNFGNDDFSIKANKGDDYDSDSGDLDNSEAQEYPDHICKLESLAFFYSTLINKQN